MTLWKEEEEEEDTDTCATRHQHLSWLHCSPPSLASPTALTNSHWSSDFKSVAFEALEPRSSNRRALRLLSFAAAEDVRGSVEPDKSNLHLSSFPLIPRSRHWATGNFIFGGAKEQRSRERRGGAEEQRSRGEVQGDGEGGPGDNSPRAPLEELEQVGEFPRRAGSRCTKGQVIQVESYQASDAYSERGGDCGGNG
uniref:Uncharacterized protein n=1 Tax=Chloropicon primus TaxID=1764295 RepID=A0A7S2T635_9CHLO